MSIMVQIADAQGQKALCDRLHTWMALACVSMNLVTPETSTPDDPPQILFWDLDQGEPPLPAREDQALFLCSRDPQRAIDSYSFHPTDFLPMPVSMERLWSAMLRCTRLWFPHLLRLEILSDRVRVGVPYQNLIWVEGTRRGCMLHTSHQSIASREPLYRLEQRLPPLLFVRCQRSFLVNLLHVQEIAGSSLYLSDGVEISLGRGNKSGVLEAYQQFCRLRYDTPEGGVP